MVRIGGLILLVFGGLLTIAACSPQYFPDWINPALVLGPIAGVSAGPLRFVQVTLASIIVLAGIAMYDRA